MAKILIADDDSSLVKIMKARLEAEGYEVVEATDGYFAVQKCGTEHPDLLLLDINMPAGDGFTVQERVAKHDDSKHVPVIYVTGQDDEALQGQADRLNAFALVRKPFQFEVLLELIREALAVAEAA